MIKVRVSYQTDAELQFIRSKLGSCIVKEKIANTVTGGKYKAYFNIITDRKNP